MQLITYTDGSTKLVTNDSAWEYAGDPDFSHTEPASDKVIHQWLDDAERFYIKIHETVEGKI